MMRLSLALAVLAGCKSNVASGPPPGHAQDPAPVATSKPRPGPAIVTGVVLPDGTGEAVPDDALVVSVTPDALYLDGGKLLALHDGRFDPSDQELSLQVMFVPALRNAFVARGTVAYTLIAADGRLPARTFGEIAASLAPRLLRHPVHLAVGDSGTVRAVTFVEHAHPATGRPTVWIAPDRLAVMAAGDGTAGELKDVAELGTMPHGDGSVVLRWDPHASVDEVARGAAVIRRAGFTEMRLYWPGFDDPELDTDAAAMGELFTTERSDSETGEMRSRRPGRDLGSQIQDELSNAGSAHR